jgi:hypothetical protein
MYIHDLIEILKTKEAELGNVQCRVNIWAGHEAAEHDSDSLPEFEHNPEPPGYLSIDFYSATWKQED